MHGLTPESLVDEVANRAPHRGAHQLAIERGVGIALGQRREDGFLQLLHQELVLFDVHEAARGDLRARNNHAALVEEVEGLARTCFAEPLTVEK